jgi:hypothetical protein
VLQEEGWEAARWWRGCDKGEGLQEMLETAAPACCCKYRVILQLLQALVALLAQLHKLCRAVTLLAGRSACVS